MVLSLNSLMTYDLKKLGQIPIYGLNVVPPGGESEIHLFLSFVVLTYELLKLRKQKWHIMRLGKAWKGVNNNFIFIPIVIMILK